MIRIFKSLFNYFLYVFLLLTPTSEVKAQVFVVDTIMYNGDPNKFINMVFMSDGFQEAELSDYKTKVQNLSNYLFTISPFSEYKNYFNVFAIRVPSIQSGATHPGTASDEGSGGQPVVFVTTYFNSTFDFASIHRLLVPQNSSAINTVLVNNFPLYDQKGIIVNSPYYGGSGGSTATSSVNSSSYEILVHELGHSFAGLADEYWAGDSYAAEKPNMTANSNSTTVKWKNWVGTNGISVYAYGASGTPANWYKPHQNCKMQFLGAPFCSVCKEAVIETIHGILPPIDNYQPSNQNNINYCTQPLLFKLSLIKPNPNTLRVKWILNGSPIVTNIDSVFITAGLLNAGTNTLSVEVLDTTLLTRADLHPVNHTYTITWNINNSSPAAATITAGGAIAFCISGSVTLTSNASTGNQWYKDGIAINDSTGNTLNVSSSGSYTVKVTVNGCESAASNAIVVTINPIPVTPVITAGTNTTFCNGGSVILTSNGSSGNQWFKDGVAIVSSTGTTLNVTSSGTYTTKVTVNGCESAVSNAILVTVTSGPPAPTISAGTATTFCNGGSVILTSDAASGNQWYKDGVAINGSTGTSLNVAASGNYTVKYTLNGCVSAVSNAIVVTVLPATPTIIAGTATTFCNGGSVTLSSNSASGNQWYKDGVAINGSTGATLNVTASGSYTVKVTLNGCESTVSNAIVITVNSIPPAPTITQNGNQLTSSAASGNQWYLNSVSVAGATSQNFTPITSGTYTVQVTLNNCASAFSTSFNVTVTGIPNINVFDNKIKILPNPVTDKLVISQSGSLLNLNIKLYDINGKLLKQVKSSLSIIEINMAKYSSGTYIIWIEDTKEKIKGKKVIVKM
jgi:hypothetical protein